jgi:hypothetical protein
MNRNPPMPMTMISGPASPQGVGDCDCVGGAILAANSLSLT